MKLSEEQIAKLREEFLGKRVELVGDGGRHVGVVDFIGYNKYLPTYGFQVTLSRTPVTNVNPNSIKIFKI
jgi:hypothetical protein